MVDCELWYVIGGLLCRWWLGYVGKFLVLVKWLVNFYLFVCGIKCLLLGGVWNSLGFL